MQIREFKTADYQQVFYQQLGYNRDDLIFMEKWLV
jgi:hypothetical protein